MTNWLADPVACAVRLKDESGCNILSGRNEVLSRSTRVYIVDEADGMTWRWGHLYTRRQEDCIVLGAEPPVGQTDHAEVVFTSTEHANVAADLLRAAYVNAGTHQCGGKTMLELFWDELMVVYERLMTGQEAEDERDPGRAEGLAFCIAVACNPYLPDIDAVREQAAERWEAMENEAEGKQRLSEHPSSARRRARRVGR